MVFFNAGRLVRNYNSGLISETQKFYYFFCVILLSFAHALISTQRSNLRSVISGSLFQLYGFVWLYYHTKEKKLSIFLEKYFVVVFPVQFWFDVLYYVLAWLLYWWFALRLNVPNTYAALVLALYVLACIIMYWYLGKKMVAMLPQQSS
jgi:hypothetical protein